MVRFIAGVGYPSQLDFCDELGLMVYEECFASWCLEESPQREERFDRSTLAMVRRDRNHPSVTIWGLLNETRDNPTFRQAVGILPRLRALDPTRLVLLGSGRWDADPTIGSVSNPGSIEWEPLWGVEGPDAPEIDRDLDTLFGGYVEQAGDAHMYPPVPHGPEVVQGIRALGRAGKPVFFSEYGIGSLMDVISEWRHFEQAGARPDLEDAVMVQKQSEALYADWERLGFDDVYPFPEDLLRESQRLHARQRTLGFDLIRSNPRLCGYNLTGMLDHVMGGEGLWTYWRDWKPATFDAVVDGWSPLRWCLFADPLHIYAGARSPSKRCWPMRTCSRPARTRRGSGSSGRGCGLGAGGDRTDPRPGAAGRSCAERDRRAGRPGGPIHVRSQPGARRRAERGPLAPPSVR